MANSKLLVVDDCRMSSLLLRHIATQEGVPSDVAATGPEGLEKALRGDYELILLDIVLPGMDGLEIASRLLRLRRENRPRIYLLTAMGEDFIPEKTREVGVDGIFFKPIVPSEIARVVNEVIGK